MSETMINTVIALSAIGLVAGAVLYFISTYFYVYEDPKIGEVEDSLPSSNCGGCGFPGCHAFAEAVVKAGKLDDLHCPVGGNDVMKQVAAILGVEAVEKDPYVAVVRCSGTLAKRPKTNTYDGVANCTLEAMLYGGDTACAYGCLGLGECADACDFDALYMDPVSGLPVVDETKCTACNACVKACPRDIIELRPQGKKGRRIYVACVSEEKGGIARKACEAACTGCAKCQKECKYEAITVENNLAYIDAELCRNCKKCVDVCGSGSIIAVNFPVKKQREDKVAATEPAVSTSKAT